jgi:hypothetical protein
LEWAGMGECDINPGWVFVYVSLSGLAYVFAHHDAHFVCISRYRFHAFFMVHKLHEEFLPKFLLGLLCGDVSSPKIKLASFIRILISLHFINIICPSETNLESNSVYPRLMPSARLPRPALQNLLSTWTLCGQMRNIRGSVTNARISIRSKLFMIFSNMSNPFLWLHSEEICLFILFQLYLLGCYWWMRE